MSFFVDQFLTENLRANTACRHDNFYLFISSFLLRDLRNLTENPTKTHSTLKGLISFITLKLICVYCYLKFLRYQSNNFCDQNKIKSKFKLTLGHCLHGLWGMAAMLRDDA